MTRPGSGGGSATGYRDFDLGIEPRRGRRRLGQFEGVEVGVAHFPGIERHAVLRLEPAVFLRGQQDQPLAAMGRDRDRLAKRGLDHPAVGFEKIAGRDCDVGHRRLAVPVRIIRENRISQEYRMGRNASPVEFSRRDCDIGRWSTRMTDTLDGEYRTGQIKLHDAAGFEGMRKAGKLGRRVPRHAGALCRARRAHREAGRPGPRVHPRPRRPARLPGLSRLHQDRLHQPQPRRLPRHPRRAGAARG